VQVAMPPSRDTVSGKWRVPHKPSMGQPTRVCPPMPDPSTWKAPVDHTH
jgi:hypothetical protein